MHNLPWLSDALKHWSIVGMNHYFLSGQRYIFVAMEDQGRCIKAEGLDDETIWAQLEILARVQDRRRSAK
jgi:hypothetical protein